MAAVASVNLSLHITGLGESSPLLSKAFSGTTPDAVAYFYRVLDTADSDEAIDLGDVSTVEGILIYAAALDLDVDCNYSSSFSADLSMPAGQANYFKPEGVIRVKNGTGSETPTYEYLVFGTR